MDGGEGAKARSGKVFSPAGWLGWTVGGVDFEQFFISKL
jgi:hypothetical protein